MPELWIYLGVISCGIIGFCISIYIYFTKQRKQTHAMVCPVGGHCDAVITSKYGKTFGIENTLLGMLYYGLIVLYFLLGWLGITLPQPEVLGLLVKLATVGGFLFSVYLISVMQFKLKQWCSWCVGSAICSTGIFLLSVFFI
jgi:uncharacterized membrane protein